MISDISLTTDIEIPESLQGTHDVSEGSISDSTDEFTGDQISDRYGVQLHIEKAETRRYNNNYVMLTFYGEDMSLYNAVKVDFVINETGRIWTEFDLPIKAHKMDIWLSGNYTIRGMEIYAVSRNVSAATTTTLGIVRPREDSAISVLADQKIDDAGNIIGEAGDIDVKIGDGLNKNEKGELCTTSNLTGSNWQNLLRFTNGFIVNGSVGTDGTVDPSTGYFFERLADGSLLYHNANRTILIASYSTNLPTYEEPKTEEGTT